jgi:hypothetical protein
MRCKGVQVKAYFIEGFTVVATSRVTMRGTSPTVREGSFMHWEPSLTVGLNALDHRRQG